MKDKEFHFVPHNVILFVSVYYVQATTSIKIPETVAKSYLPTSTTNHRLINSVEIRPCSGYMAGKKELLGHTKANEIGGG